MQAGVSVRMYAGTQVRFLGTKESMSVGLATVYMPVCLHVCASVCVNVRMCACMYVNVVRQLDGVGRPPAFNPKPKMPKCCPSVHRESQEELPRRRDPPWLPKQRPISAISVQQYQRLGFQTHLSLDLKPKPMVKSNVRPVPERAPNDQDNSPGWSAPSGSS